MSKNRTADDTGKINLTIPISTDTTNSVNIENWTSAKILVPSGMDGASLTIEESDDDVTFTPLRKDDGTDVTITLGSGAGRYLLPPATYWSSTGYVRFVSDVTETAARTLTLYVRAMG